MGKSRQERFHLNHLKNRLPSHKKKKIIIQKVEQSSAAVHAMDRLYPYAIGFGS
jgi:hypothetical protein